jgi:hypothetical protein
VITVHFTSLLFFSFLTQDLYFELMESGISLVPEILSSVERALDQIEIDPLIAQRARQAVERMLAISSGPRN